MSVNLNALILNVIAVTANVMGDIELDTVFIVLAISMVAFQLKDKS